MSCSCTAHERNDDQEEERWAKNKEETMEEMAGDGKEEIEDDS